jgi:integrase
MGYYTGMREGEILKLTWDRVDLGSRLIHLTKDMTKERKPKTILFLPMPTDRLKTLEMD